MKKKIVIALIALAVILAAGAAALYAAYQDVDEIEITEVVTVTEESMPDAVQGEEAAAGAQSEEAEEEIEIVDLSGMITEVTDEYVVLDAGEMGMIQANISDDTLIEGVDELLAGQTAVIIYDGKMTRSIPAQITALHIGVYAVTGTVEEVGEGRVTIIQDEVGAQAVITLPENAPEIAVGDSITAYTNGAATMSLPPQMNAIAVVK